MIRKLAERLMKKNGREALPDRSVPPPHASTAEMPAPCPGPVLHAAPEREEPLRSGDDDQEVQWC